MSFEDWKANCASQTSTNLAYGAGAAATGALLYMTRGSLGATAALSTAGAAAIVGIHATAVHNDDLNPKPSQIRGAAYGVLTVGVLASGYAVLKALGNPVPTTSRDLIAKAIAPLMGLTGGALLWKTVDSGSTGEFYNWQRDMRSGAWFAAAGTAALATAWAGMPTAVTLLTTAAAAGYHSLNNSDDVDSPSNRDRFSAAAAGYIASCLISGGLVACDLANGAPLSMKMLATNAVRFGSHALAIQLFVDAVKNQDG
jgi:hypothetical protein